jgi:hypothetical protein
VPAEAPAAFRHEGQAVASRDDLDGDARGGKGIIRPDESPDSGQVREGLGREDYGHSGADNPLSVPQDRSQGRTSS